MNKVQIAQNILDQLGNNKFLAITGAKDLVVGDNANWAGFLQFKISGNRIVQIGLLADDTYQVKMVKLNKKTFEFQTVADHAGVMVDRLRDTFTKMSGLYCTI